VEVMSEWIERIGWVVTLAAILLAVYWWVRS
jgi:hypothetical protein